MSIGCRNDFKRGEKEMTMLTHIPVSRLKVQWQHPDALGGFGAVYFAHTTDGDQATAISHALSGIALFSF